MSPADIVNKLWNYRNVLRDDLSACGHAQAGGTSYLPAARVAAQASGDYVELLTYLLFLKMADEPVCVQRTGRRAGKQQTRTARPDFQQVAEPSVSISCRQRFLLAGSG